jgi:hypothetical protein
MIERRGILFGGAAVLAGSRPARAVEMSPAERLDTMVRLRASADGAVSYAYLDAVRSTFIDGEIAPFCRMLSFVAQKFARKDEGYEATLLEVAYYLDPQTGAFLETVKMPGTGKTVKVPVYRTGPAKVRFAATLDEWEEHDPAAKGGATAAFAPKASVHLQRSVGTPYLDADALLIRADEYGRVYPDKAKPPTIFYREWIIWRGDADAVLKSKAPSVAAEFTYSALSSWRPWMEMGDVKGHTAENGRGRKLSGLDAIPPELRALMKARDPDVLAAPDKLLG